MLRSASRRDTCKKGPDPFRFQRYALCVVLSSARVVVRATMLAAMLRGLGACLCNVF